MVDKSPRVSVILPVHNASRYLPHALENLREMDDASIEFVVIDDHSDDDSADILGSWPGALANVQLLSNEGRGVAAARNQAVASAHGDYLWFADCDDDWSADIVATMLAAADRSDADVVVCNARKVARPGGSESLIEDAPAQDEITGSEALSRLLDGRVQGHLWNKLFRRSLFDHIVFPPTRAHSDLGAMFPLLAAARTVALIPDTLYTYYVHAGSILNQNEYRWDDLWDCLAIAERSVEASGHRAELTKPLTIFTYRNVIVPSVNESLRREDNTNEATITSVRRRSRVRASVPDVVHLARWGQRDAAVRGLLIKVAFPLYRAIYRRYRRQSWSAVDEFQA
jgi:glycosyltransferase involved in cell wall biosynthesis